MKSRIGKEKFTFPEGLTEEKLRKERDFVNYVRMLKSFAKKYCVIIAVSGTPCFHVITTQYITKEIMNIGLNIDLYKKINCPYIAVIDGGSLLCEKIDRTTLNVLKENVRLAGTEDEIEIISAGLNAPEDNQGIIKINGVNYSPDSTGINIVVYDKYSKNVMDAVALRTTGDVGFYRPAYTYNILEMYRQSHPGVTVVEYLLPTFPKSNLTENEKFIIKYGIRLDNIMDHVKDHSVEMCRYYDDETVEEVLRTPRSYIDITGARRFEDVHGKHVNIVGGHRVTHDQPVQGDKKIYLYGPCKIYGIGVSDEHTVASQLQKILNEFAPQYKIIVQNCGSFLVDMHDEYLGKDSVAYKTLNSFPVRPGDIVLYYGGLPLYDQYMPKIDMLKAAREPRDFEMFFDRFHYTPNGNKFVAEKLYEGLAEQGILDKAHELASERENAPVTNNTNFDQNTNEQLAEYKKFLIDFYNSSLNQPTGAIVMNCNPFTLGHRYLIEKALEQCSFLIIFLVEEDRSEFSFEERLKLVDEGTKDIPNLAIIPSGKFVLSSLTFSEYFNKAELQDRVIDTSLDVTVFAREIAPCLHITKRFAGEEPLDNVTRQYNETMRRVLPEYGIEFVEIPRVEFDSKPISASRVRELAKSGRYSELKDLVPQTTLNHLVEKYKL